MLKYLKIANFNNMFKKSFLIFLCLIFTISFVKNVLAEMPPAPPNDDNIVDGDIDDEDNGDYVNATLMRSQSGYKVYEIKEGQRHWIPTGEIFNHYRFNWQDIQVVSESNLMSYPRAKLLRITETEPVYYLTESGMIRHIPSASVFESYGNNWEDVFEINSVELEVYEPNHLIRQEGGYKVYHLENGTKHWIKTPEAFNKRSYDWNKIAPVNQTEIQYYPTGSPLE